MSRKQIKGENKELRAQVEALNQKYFGGKLRIDTVGYFAEISMNVIGQAQMNGYRGSSNAWYGLGVNPILSAASKMGFDMTETLIHELIHIWQYQNDKLDRECEGHGKWFNAKAMQIMAKSPEYKITRYATKEESKMIEIIKKIRMKKMMGM